MKKIYLIFSVFLIFLAIYFFWPFERRSFEAEKAFPVEVRDNGINFELLADQKTTADLLRENNIPLGEKDYVFPAPEARIYPGCRIMIRRAIPVTIEVDDQTIKLDTLGTSVRDAINEGNVILSHVDKVKPEPNSLLTPDLNIVITRINFEEVTLEEDIAFKTVEKEDSSVLWRKREVKQKGEKGIREKTYKITYTNGKETKRELLLAKVAKDPVSQIEVVGTKIVVGKTQTGDATWYSFGDGMTCASLKFPRGKYLRVTNRANGKKVIVQVNDSGPYGDGRVIDLNKKAFQKIADLGAGVINVKVEEILN